MRVAVAAVAVVVVSLSGFRTAAPPANAESTAVMGEFIQTVNWVAENFNTGPILVTTEFFPDPNTFAMTVGRQIVLNGSYASDPLELYADIQHNVNTGWIPAGCSPARTVALHEAAHVIDNTRGRIGTRRVAATFPQGIGLQGQVSLYSYGDDGVFDADEAVASAFQSVLCNGGTDVELDMYYMLVQP